MRHRISREFFDAVVLQADRLHLLSDEHFSVDGTLIEAAASLKSFRPKDEPPPPKRPDGGSPSNRWVDFHGQKRSNDTHQSTTDPDSVLYRKGHGKEARLYLGGHLLMENRHGLCMLFAVTPSVGVTESQQAAAQVRELQDREFAPRTVGADKGYHSKDFVQGCREAGVAPEAGGGGRRAGRRAIRAAAAARGACGLRAARGNGGPRRRWRETLALRVHFAWRGPGRWR
jgi:hypothetical protein